MRQSWRFCPRLLVSIIWLNRRAVVETTAGFSDRVDLKGCYSMGLIHEVENEVDLFNFNIPERRAIYCRSCATFKKSVILLKAYEGTSLSLQVTFTKPPTLIAVE